MLVAALTAWTVAGACRTGPVPAPEKPGPAAPRNLLVIISDDHAAYVTGAYGNSVVRTPHIDSLAARGARLTQAFANSPVCTPSRQSFLTSKYPQAVGVTLLRTPLAEEEVTLADHLKGLGYATGAVGKMHFQSDLTHGFDYRFDEKSYAEQMASGPAAPLPPDLAVKPRWRPFRDPARIWLNADGLPLGVRDTDSRSAFYVEKSVEFLKTYGNRPFCLWVSFNEPHSPFDFPIEFAGRYRPAEMPVPPVGREDEAWIPAVFRGLTEADKQGITAAYYTSTEFMDAKLGQVLQVLDDLNLRDNTLVIYLSDHGYLLGHHGRFEKHSMWEEAVRVPLIFSHSSVAAGTVEDLTELVDVVPTALELMGAPPLPTAQGRSLAARLRGAGEPPRQLVFSVFHPDNLAMIRDRRWKYVFTSGRHDLAMGYQTGRGAPGRTERLYDLSTDPNEMRSLAREPAQQALLQEMRLKMLERFLETDPRAPDLPADLPLLEQLEWFLMPPEGVGAGEGG